MEKKKQKKTALKHKNIRKYKTQNTKNHLAVNNLCVKDEDESHTLTAKTRPNQIHKLHKKTHTKY